MRLKGRYQRAGRKDRDTIGVAIHSLSRALDGTSDDDLATAMTRSMSALGIQPAPVPSMQRPSSPPPSETRPAPSMPTRTVAPEPKRKAQAEPIEPPRQRPQVATEPPARRTRPVRPVRTGPSRFDRWAKNLKKSSSQAWSRVTADFAAHTLTYLGVVLSIVVVFVFYTTPLFGQYVAAPWRPLFFVGVVVLFLSLARMLRHGTGIPATATAVELIGLLIVPMSLAGFFRDACYPGEHLTCLVPDVGGPARWMVYEAVGLVTAIVYYVFAKRRAIYAYIVAPMVWAAIGALGLYLEDGLGIVFGADAASMSTFVHDGMSGWQS